jgi:hypothetical protein
VEQGVRFDDDVRYCTTVLYYDKTVQYMTGMKVLLAVNIVLFFWVVITDPI